MGRAPCCSKVGLRRGPWTLKEDSMLVRYIQIHGEGHWRSLPKKAGLLRCGKSCRLRWMNYLRPDIKRGNISPDEDDLIIRLHSLLGNRWSLIAGRLPGRTDNEIKNYWNSHLSKKVSNLNHNTAHGATAAAKGYRGPKRRTTPKTSKIDRSKKDETIAKIKVHQPKATRISLAPSPALLPYNNQIMPRNTSIDSGSSSTEERADQLEPSNNIKDNDNNIVDVDQEEENDFANILINCVSDLSPSSSYSWHENNQIFLPGIDNADIAAASTSSSNSDQNKDSDKQMLEKIFEEYQELLRPEDHVQLESFVDSLLI